MRIQQLHMRRWWLARRWARLACCWCTRRTITPGSGCVAEPCFSAVLNAASMRI